MRQPTLVSRLQTRRLTGVHILVLLLRGFLKGFLALLCSFSGPGPGPGPTESQGSLPPAVEEAVHPLEQCVLNVITIFQVPSTNSPRLYLLDGLFLLSPGLQAFHVRGVAVAAHHCHALALGDGAATAAMDRMLPAGPVHLAPHSLLPLVEEGLMYQESAPVACLQELKGPIPYWRKNPRRSHTKDKSPGSQEELPSIFLPNALGHTSLSWACVKPSAFPASHPRGTRFLSKSIISQSTSSHHNGRGQTGL